MDLAISLCIQFPDLLGRGKVESWAGGIVHTICHVNFMSDPSFSPHITMSDINSFFEVSKGTIQSKSKKIRDLFGTYPMDPMWTLPELLMENPMMWTVPINGIMIDIRTASPETQQKALDLGLIPMLPETLRQQINEYYEVIKSSTESLYSHEDGKKDVHKPNIRLSDYQK